jgi:hypothetical protein
VVQAALGFLVHATATPAGAEVVRSDARLATAVRVGAERHKCAAGKLVLARLQDVDGPAARGGCVLM